MPELGSGDGILHDSFLAAGLMALVCCSTDLECREETTRFGRFPLTGIKIYPETSAAMRAFDQVFPNLLIMPLLAALTLIVRGVADRRYLIDTIEADLTPGAASPAAAA